MRVTAFWKAIYTHGHDTACLSQLPDGWCLEGMAVYLKDDRPAAIHYRLEFASDWGTRHGTIKGIVGGDVVNHRITRDTDGWVLNGQRQDGLAGVVDLDFGFTPATNHPQLRRMALKVGETREIVVAWMDVKSTSLSPLPQIYKRWSENEYDYNSPKGPYRATLQTAPSGFVSLYPDLWETVS